VCATLATADSGVVVLLELTSEWDCREWRIGVASGYVRPTRIFRAQGVVHYLEMDMNL